MTVIMYGRLYRTRRSCGSRAIMRKIMISIAAIVSDKNVATGA